MSNMVAFDLSKEDSAKKLRHKMSRQIVFKKKFVMIVPVEILMSSLFSWEYQQLMLLCKKAA